MQTVKCKETLECKLTPNELADYGRKLARENQAKAERESAKKSYVAQLGADIKAHVAEIERISGLVNGGYELRLIETETSYHCPVEGRKQTVRLDTGATIREGKMTPEELENLFLNALGDQGETFVFSTPRREVDLIDLTEGDIMATGWIKCGNWTDKPAELVKATLAEERQFCVSKEPKGVYQLWINEEAAPEPKPDEPQGETAQEPAAAEPPKRKGKAKAKPQAAQEEPEKPAPGAYFKTFVLASGHSIHIWDFETRGPVEQGWVPVTDSLDEASLSAMALGPDDKAEDFLAIRNGEGYCLYHRLEPQAEQPAANPFDALTGDATDTDNNQDTEAANG